MIGFRWVWGGFEGVKGCFGGSRGVCLTPIWHFVPPWKSCMAPDMVPNTTWWSNWPILKGQASLTYFQTFEVIVGAPKGPVYKQIKPS